MPRQTPTIDVEPFRDTIAASIVAFATDPGYAVEMAERARAIIAKRLSWACRSELRRAEAEAMRQCARAEGLVCPNLGPACGVGPGCPFARPEHAELQLDPACRVRSSTAPLPRPRPGPTGETTSAVELVVPVLVAIRTRQHRASLPVEEA